MKNLPYSHLLASIRSRTSSGLWQDLRHTAPISRAEVGLSTDYASAKAYVDNPKHATETIVKWLRARGYLTLAHMSTSFTAILPHPTEDYIVAALAFNAPEETGDITIYGDDAEVAAVKAWYRETYSRVGSVITVAEGFMENGRIEKTFKYMPKGGVQLAHQSFYPWLPIPLAEYFDAFMKSDEAVLVLFGPPGTGKSTFLRSLIAHGDYDAWLAYNRDVVQSYKTVAGFFRSPATILAYEDIDQYLGKREDGNALMSTILNASEGILQHPGKKIVFSTNLPSIDRIDPALLRVGRCFDILNFEMLNKTEALSVRAGMGLPPRDFTGKDAWPLSEVLVKESAAQQTINRFGRKMGF